MELDDILERVIRAESEASRATELLTVRHAETVDYMKSVDARLGTLEQALAKYTGFWGAIMLVASAVGTAIMLAKEFFLHKFGVNS